MQKRIAFVFQGGLCLSEESNPFALHHLVSSSADWDKMASSMLNLTYTCVYTHAHTSAHMKACTHKPTYLSTQIHAFEHVCACTHRCTIKESNKWTLGSETLRHPGSLARAVLSYSGSFVPFPNLFWKQNTTWVHPVSKMSSEPFWVRIFAFL